MHSRTTSLLAIMLDAQKLGQVTSLWPGDSNALVLTNYIRQMGVVELVLLGLQNGKSKSKILRGK